MAQDLSAQDIMKMINKLEIRLPNISPAFRRLEKLDPKVKVFAFFNILEKRQDISRKDCSLLYQLLSFIHRTDLQHFIDPYSGNV